MLNCDTLTHLWLLRYQHKSITDFIIVDLMDLYFYSN